MSTYFTFLSAVCHYTIIKKINETSHDRMFCKQKMVNGRVRGNNITPGGIRCTMAYCQGINIVLCLRYKKFLQRFIQKKRFIHINWLIEPCKFAVFIYSSFFTELWKIVVYKTIVIQQWKNSNFVRTFNLLPGN